MVNIFYQSERYSKLIVFTKRSHGEIMETVCYSSVTINPAQMEGIWVILTVLFGRRIETEHHDFDFYNISGLRPFIQRDVFAFYSLIFLDYLCGHKLPAQDKFRDNFLEIYKTEKFLGTTSCKNSCKIVDT